MKLIILSTLALLFASCTGLKKIPEQTVDTEFVKIKEKYNFSWDSIEIQKLNIKILEGLPGFSAGDLNVSVIPIDSLSLEIDTNNITPINGKLRIITIDADTVSVGFGCGNLTDKSPHRIGMVSINKLTLTKNEKIITTISKPTNIVNFKIYAYDLQCPRLAPSIDSIEFRIVDLEERIKKLLVVIEELVSEMPDHAAQKLPPTLQAFLANISSIKGFYFRQDEMLITAQTEADLNQLNNIKFSVEVQEVEVDNPNNNPQAIENEVLFKTGKFEISSSAPVLDRVINDINAKILGLEKTNPDMPVKIILLVTGYADEQEIEKDLEQILRDKYPNENISDAQKQEILNKLLSQARADNVYSYLTTRLPSKTRKGQPINFERAESRGKGWIYPPNLKKPCVDNCQKRRVVYTSHIVYPKR